MKLALVFIALCAAVCAASGTKLLASSQRQLNYRETNLVKRLFRRQAYGEPPCDRRACAVPNCGKDYVAGLLPGECCERCIPWEYAQSIGIRGPQAVQDPRSYQPQRQDPYYQPQQVQSRADVYIFGPDDGARVSNGQSIYFDCEVASPYNPNAQPRWSRGGNQPLAPKSQSTLLPGNRKLLRLTIPDATPADAGRYECSAGSGEQASIDLQVTDGGYYPRPQPQPQPAYNPYNQYPYNQPGYNPQPQPQPQPQPYPYPQPHHPQPHPQPAHGGHGANDDDGDDEHEQPGARPTPAAKPTPAPQADAEDGADQGEYPEDYTENE